MRAPRLNATTAAQAVLARSLPKPIAGTAAARPLDLEAGSYYGRRRFEDGRIDWRRSACAVHHLVPAVRRRFRAHLPK